MVVGDRLGDILQQHGLTRARRGDDQRALALALRADDVDHPRRLVLDRRVERVERQLLVRIQWREIVKIGPVANRVGIVEIDLVERRQRKIALALARCADLALDRVAGTQAPFADLVGRDVDIVGAGKIVRLGAAQEAETVLQHFDGADPHDLFFVFFVFGELAQNAEHQVLPPHGRSALDPQFFGHRDQVCRGFLFQVLEMHKFYSVIGWMAGRSVGPSTGAGLGLGKADPVPSVRGTCSR